MNFSSPFFPNTGSFYHNIQIRNYENNKHKLPKTLNLKLWKSEKLKSKTKSQLLKTKKKSKLTTIEERTLNLFSSLLHSQDVSKFWTSQLPESLARFVHRLLLTNFSHKTRTFAGDYGHVRCWILYGHNGLCLLRKHHPSIKKRRLCICEHINE